MAAAAGATPTHIEGTAVDEQSARGAQATKAWSDAATKGSVTELTYLLDAAPMYLLDTNVLSELRRPRPHGAVLNWIDAVPNEQRYVCAVTVGEIQAGIELTRRQDPSKAEELDAWLDDVVSSHQVLAIDAATSRRWARLMVGKSDTLLEDAMIAACALANELIVVTRNVRDFAVFGVRTLNPFLSPRT